VAETVIAPQNTIIDRRPIVKGTALDYWQVAPCGVWLRVYFTSADGVKQSTVWLVSQYGTDTDYGTDTAENSTPYATQFRAAERAEPLH
jgi:hypothetical protein